MRTLIPLSSLMATGRDPSHRVGHDGEQWLLWPAFHEQVARCAHALSQRSEVRWLLISEDPLVFATQLMALLHAGKKVIIPPNTQPGTLDTLKDEFDAVVDVTLGTQAQPLHALETEEACIALYTSGSTGTPKAVHKTLRQFEAELSALEAQFGARLNGCSVLGTAPHHHLYGLTFRVLWPLSAGRPTDGRTCTHPDMYLERLAVMGEGLLVSSPAQLSRWPDLMSLKDLPLKPRMVLSAGGPLSAITAKTLCDLLGEAPTEIYGSSETGVIAWRRQDVSELWTPLLGVTVDTDESGALVVHSPLLEGDQVFRMDDAVALMPNGQFRLKGRLDRTVKIEEKRLFLPDMEAHLVQHDAIANVMLALLEGSRQFLGAVAVLTDEGQAQLALRGRRELIRELQHHVRQYFDHVLVPRRWRFPMHMPFNDRGKLTKEALVQLFEHEE